MSVQKLDATRWLIRVRHRQDGKMLQRKLIVTGNRLKADEQELELRKQLEAGPVTPCSLKIHSLREALEYYEGHTTAKMYKIQPLFNRLKNEIGNVRIVDLRSKWADYVELLKHTISAKTKEAFTSTTRNKLLGYAKIALNLCMKHGLIDRNPLVVYSKEDEEPRDRVLDNGEVTRLMKALAERKSYLYWPVYFSLRNPIRRGDLAALRRENLDMFKPWVHFQPSKTKRKKKRETCLVFIDERLMRYFKGEQVDQLPTLPPDCPYLFPYVHESGWRKMGDFKNHWKSVLAAAEIDDFHWHDMKHHAITAMLDDGYSERDIKNLGIQYAPAMIDRYYKLDANKVLQKFKKMTATVAPAVAPQDSKMLKFA